MAEQALWEALTVKQLFTFVFAVAGVLMSLGTAGSVLFVAYKRSERFRNWCRSAVTAPARVAVIEKELSPNGGGSIKDQLTRVAKDVSHLRIASRAVVEMMDTCGFKLDHRGEFAAVTRGFTLVTGLDTRQARDGGWLQAVCDDDRDLVADKWEEAMRLHRAFIAEFCFINLRTNLRTDVRVVAKPRFDEANEVDMWVGDVQIIQRNATENMSRPDHA